jgi:ketosteroid isomerase-like protein
MGQPEDIHAFADRFMDALNGTDTAAVRAFYTDDATCWHNFDDVDQPINDNMKLFEWMVRKAPQRRYRVLRRDLVPGGWFQQHVLEAQLPNGKAMRLLACCVITLQDGRIRRIEEYVDPSQASVLREPKAS